MTHTLEYHHTASEAKAILHLDIVQGRAQTNDFSRKIGCNSTLAFFVSGPERFKTDSERTPNGPGTDPERTPHGPRMDPVRPSNRSRTDPEQTPRGPRANPAQTPNGFRTDLSVVRPFLHPNKIDTLNYMVHTKKYGSMDLLLELLLELLLVLLLLLLLYAHSHVPIGGRKAPPQ